jgi:hypothetical protein
MECVTEALTAHSIFDTDCEVAGLFLLIGGVPVSHERQLRRNCIDYFEPFTLEHATCGAGLPITFENARAGYRIEMEEGLDVIVAVDVRIVLESCRDEEPLAGRIAGASNEPALDPIMSDISGIGSGAHAQRNMRRLQMRHAAVARTLSRSSSLQVGHSFG